MLIDCTQLKEIIIVPTLTALGMNSPSAVNLLLGTCAHESHMGRYIKQVSGCAFGIYQCQPQTYEYVWANSINKSVSLKARIRLMLGYEIKPNAIRLSSDLLLATAICRLYYATFTDPLPAPDDVAGLAAYWKKYYNTKDGAGTEEKFIENYHRYVV